MRTEESWMWMLGGAVLIGTIVATAPARPRYSFGRPDRRDGLSRDPNKLLPAFADKVEILFQRLRARKLDPCLQEGYRSRARAEMLAKDPDGDGPKKAPGIADSMHCYGAAVDIVSCSKLYEHPAFFRALGVEAKRLKLTWGGDFGDKPHVQALPYTKRAQDGLRASNDRNTLIKKYIG